MLLKPYLQWSGTDVIVNNRRCPTSLWPLPIPCDALLQPANTWRLHPAPLLISSCLIWAPWHTLKFVFHYSLFNMRDCLLAACCYLLDSEPAGQLKDSTVSFHHLQASVQFSPTPPSPSSLCLPPMSLAATPGNYKLVHNNNSQRYLSILRSNLSAVSGVAERLAGVKGQLINGAQFDKSQRLLSSSRAFRAKARTTEINA